MAQFCCVAPPQIIKGFADFGMKPKAHLLLAHDIVDSSKQDLYRELFDARYFYEKRPNIWFQCPELVILDNSVVELGRPVEFEMIREATKAVNPHCIALPDAYLDTDATIAQCKEAIDPWYEGLRDLFDWRGPAFMYLPQGKTKEDFTRAALEFARDPRIKWWGVPRNIVQYHGSRKWAVELLRILNPNRYIHLFGFSDDILDDAMCAQIHDVASIDSAVPLRCHHAGLTFRDAISQKMPPRGDWWEKGKYTIQVSRDYDAAYKLMMGRGL